jgi:hypothetical protein
MQQYADISLLESHFAVNKYLHTVASSWILLTLNYVTLTLQHFLFEETDCYGRDVYNSVNLHH